MTLTKEKAWVIFRADTLQQPEGKAALNAMTKAEFEAYECYAEEFDLEIAQIGMEAQNEAAALTEGSIVLDMLQAKKQHSWTAADYINLISVFRDSKFETLHLSAMFRVPNNELLLELVKP